MVMTTHEMFGGAIRMVLPLNLLDASDLRQVPDNQEVFLFPDSDVSFVLEVLERVNASDDEDAAKFHFDSLARDNSAISEILDITLPPTLPSSLPPATPRPIILVGTQEVQKFNQYTVDHVQILMALYRIQAKGVDLVLTANIPQAPAKGEQSEGWQNAKNIFDTAAASLEIVDFGLFA